MNILVTVNAAWNIWNFRRPMMKALIDDGHSVTILAPKDDAVTQLEALGCRVRHLDMDVKGLNPIGGLTLVRQFGQLFRELKPDVVFSFTIKNNIFGALAAKSMGIPFVPNVTGLGTAFLSGRLIEQVAMTLYKHAFRKLPIVFFQNDDDRALFVSRGLITEGQARRVPGSGIDLDRFVATSYPAAEEAPVFLMIARLLRDKGVLEYVEAARCVKASHPTARFQLLGAPDAMNRTAISRDEVRAWEKEGLIKYLETTEDVRPLIAKAHCVVLPSYLEGAPRTLIEAAAMARPVIATDVPGCRAVVQDGITGFLCEVRNGRSLAAACARFLELAPEARVAMGQAGRVKMEREFALALVVDAYRSVLRDLTPPCRTTA